MDQQQQMQLDLLVTTDPISGPAASVTPPQGRNPYGGLNRVAAVQPLGPDAAHSVAALLQHRGPHPPNDVQQHTFDVSSACSPVADDSGIASDMSGSISAYCRV